jgi:hypothetical protein
MALICKTRLPILMVVMAALSGCTTSQAPAPVTSATATGYPPGVTPSRFKLPEGEGCSGETARFRAVMDNDLATGHVNTSVHQKVTSEIDQAASACSSGDAGKSLAMLRTTKTRYGYP